MMWCFSEIHKDNLEHVGEEGDILEDLAPADVRVLLQAEEELSQVPFLVPMFRGNKVNVTMFLSARCISLTLFKVSMFCKRKCFQCQQWERVFPTSESSLDHLLLPEAG